MVVLATNSPAVMRKVQQRVKAARGRVVQSYGPQVLVVEGAPNLNRALRRQPGVHGVYAGPVPNDDIERLDETGQLGVAAWNHRHDTSFREAKLDRTGEGLSWTTQASSRRGDALETAY